MQKQDNVQCFDHKIGSGEKGGKLTCALYFPPLGRRVLYYGPRYRANQNTFIAKVTEFVNNAIINIIHRKVGG